MNKIKVLFVCVHNSARSQLAEEFLKKLGADDFEVDSAGLEPGPLNPYVIKILEAEGIDISKKMTKSVFDIVKQERIFNFVITVCDQIEAEKCPVFPGRVNRLHWSFPDPSSFTGPENDILAQVSDVRNQVEAKVKEFIQYLKDNGYLSV